MSDDGELTYSTTRRPEAIGPMDPVDRGGRSRLAVPALLCLTMVVTPLVLLKSAIGHSRRPGTTVAATGPKGPTGRAPAGTVRGGVRGGILTTADLAAVSADGGIAPAPAAEGPAGTAASGAGVPAASAPRAASNLPEAHIASVSPASPVTSSPPVPPTTGPSPAAPPPSPTTTEARPTTTTTAPARSTSGSSSASASSSSSSETGSASWYSAPAGTCAHPSLPFGTVVRVTNLANGASTTCTVEDRGPYSGGRIIDLSEATFSQIASTSDGVIQVRISW